MSKLVWVTSARSAIGTALCQAFVCQGYRVHLLQASATLPANVQVLPWPVAASWPPQDLSPDARPDGTIQQWLQQQEARTGPVDTLLYVAEATHTASTVQGLHALLLTLHARLRQRQQGRIILVLPALDSDAPAPGALSNPSIRKLAQQGLGQGVTVNVIRTGPAPALIKTLPGTTPTPAAPMDQSLHEAKPLSAHLSQAEEVANLALWLASAEAGYLTGAEFVIMGPG